MPFRPPLVAHEYFSADPPELPRRSPGEPGPEAVVRAELTGKDSTGVTLRAYTATGTALHLQLSAAGEGILRVRLSDDPAARTRSARVLPLTQPDPGAVATVVAADNSISVTAGALTAHAVLSPWSLSFQDTVTGRELLRSDPGLVDISGRLRNLPLGCSRVDGRIVAYHESFTLPADEVLTGTGERFTALNLRGQRPVMWNFDAFGSESDRAYKNVPFYQSSRGYGLVVDSGLPVEYDFGAATGSVTQLLVPDDALDYYVLAGPTPAAVLDRFDALTCRPQCPPKWAFGSWISSGFCRDSQEQVLARAATIRAHGIPCDVLHLDTYWQPDGRWSELRWDPETFPDPEGMLATLHEQGFRVCVWMNPYLSHHSDRFTEAAERGFLLRRADGEVYVADSWHGSFPPGGIVDFTNPEAVAWFQDLLRPIARQGVDVFKTDFAEGVPADAVAHNGMTGTELHNVYSLLYNDAVMAVTREVHGHGMVWARSSYLGGQRHAAQWGGDTMCSYPALASSLNGGLAHGMSGVPYWSHDSGGFCGTPSDDLYLRWAQFGALSPLLRFHGTTTREPWRFPAVEAATIEALKLRYRLLPYLYSAALRAQATGEPIMRALAVDSPADPASWRAEHQYRLGADLLVAPMISETQRRDVYLPPSGSGGWVCWWTGEVYPDTTTMAVAPALDRVPLYVRRHALIPTTDPAEHVADGPWQRVTLLSFGGGDATCELLDDDYASTVIAHRSGDTLAVTIVGPARLHAIAFPDTAGCTPPATVLVNGVEAPLSTVDGLLTASLAPGD
ncbi:alpha-xylosidase [Catellatospora sp. TT07R-123]|uniref:TIM-barrel domain-containing protein n=1 Tax=Catellatospora sp. TT07R-123 TaxID=2733863 RepID=UPI001AFE51A8|nr:TIM-barrel domain-containing protein [Catellatospora sp. TT07R-123]GHJ50147.1 alpha-xylosidase [Catellatospora sp. TT07R-123]